jgi:hypothetical protein
LIIILRLRGVQLLKSDLIKLRKKIFTNLRSKAYGYEGNLSIELKKYRRDLHNFAQRSFSKTTFSQLKKRVSNSDIVYIGDFHTFDQNIRNVLRIMKVLISQKDKCIIALEMVDAQFQIFIDAYLSGHITDLEFLESINYHDSWRFPWTHYKLIFELAREHQIKIIGINTHGNLTHRDTFAAKACARALQNNQAHKLMVLYGELHLSPNKIPALMEKQLPHIKQLIIHQNLDEVYWGLVESEDNADIVKFNKNEFCINSAPPWVKYESMVYWYENLCDDPEFDIHEYIIENGKKTFSEDINDNFLQMCSEMIKILNLDIELEDLANFNLKDHSSLEYIEDLILELNNNSLKSYYQYLIETSQSFRLIGRSIYYCSSYSMNRMAYLAGIHIFHYYIRKDPILEEFNKRGVDRFVLMAYEAMFAFFFSKVINPHRKCEMYQDIQKRKRLKTITSYQKKIYEMSIDILNGKELKFILRGKRLKQLHLISLYVGHILGDYLYQKVFEYGEANILSDEVFAQKINSSSFKKIRKKILLDFDYKNHIKRYF